jgi:hypothetical protein
MPELHSFATFLAAAKQITTTFSVGHSHKLFSRCEPVHCNLYIGRCSHGIRAHPGVRCRCYFLIGSRMCSCAPTPKTVMRGTSMILSFPHQMSDINWPAVVWKITLATILSGFWGKSTSQQPTILHLLRTEQYVGLEGASHA